MATKIDEFYAELGLKANAFYSGIAKAESKFSMAGKKMSDIGRSMTKYVTAPLVGIGAASIKMSVDFNKAMANVATLIPGTGDRILELKKNVQDMAIETGKSTQDLADGLYQVISAFGDTAQSSELLKIAARASVAGVAQTTDAINLLSAVTKGYGDTSAAALQQTSDLAFMTVKLGQTTFPELAASMGRVVPLAKQLGVAQEEMFAVMATGTGVTGTASEVSTQLRGVLQSMMNPTAQLSKLMAELGYENANAMIASEGLGGAMQTIVAAAQKSGMSLQSFIGQVEGQTIALALAGAQADVFDEKLKQMGETAGATDAAYAAQTEGINTLGHSWQQLQRTVEVAGQQIGDAIGEALDKETVEQLSTAVTDLITAFGSLTPEMKANIIKFAALAAAIGPVIAIGEKLIAALKWIGSAVASMGAAMTAVIATALVPIGLAFKTLQYEAQAAGQGTWQFWMNGWHMLWQDIVHISGQIAMTIINTFNRIVSGAKSFGSAVVAAVVAPFNRIVSAAQAATQRVTAAFRSMYDAVVGHSYVPDMVNEVKAWMLRLGSDALVDPAVASTEEGAAAFKRMNDSIKGTISDLGKELELIQAKHQVWGDAVDVNAESANALEQAINSLLQNGMQPADPVIVELTAQHTALTAAMNEAAAAANRLDYALGAASNGLAATLSAIDAVNAVLSDLTEKTKLAAMEQEVFGNASWTLSNQITDVRASIVTLLKAGYKPTDAAIKKLTALYKQLTAEQQMNAAIAEATTQIYTTMGEVMNGVSASVAQLANVTNRINMSPLQNSMNTLKNSTKADFAEMESAAFDWKGTMLGVFGSVLTSGQSVFGALSYAAASYFGIPVQLAGFIEPALGAVWEGVSWVGETLWEGVSWVGETLWSGISAIGHGISSIGSSIWHGVRNVAHYLNPFNWFADGGTMRATGMAVVGEEGPEILNLNAGDTITPLNKIGEAVGGGMMNIVVELDGRMIGSVATKYMPGTLRLQGVSR